MLNSLMRDVNRRSYILSMEDLNNTITTRNFYYSKNANKVNVHKRKNQNIPSGYLSAQS